MSRTEAKERSQGNCELRISRDCTGEGLHQHHRKLRSQGGTDVTANLISVDPFCHTYIHTHPEESYRNGWLVRSWENPEDVPVVRYAPTGKPCPRCKGTGKDEAKPITVLEKPRQKVSWSMKIPKDERENGYELWIDVLERVRQKATPLLGLSDSAPAYYFLLPVLEDWLTNE